MNANNNNNSHDRNHQYLNDNEITSGSFQLPSLPPWKTPRFKLSADINLTTPLKRPTKGQSTGNNQAAVKPDGAVNQTLDIKNMDLSERDISEVLDVDVYEEGEFNYQPFSTKTLLRESKIKNYLRAERAAHCLVFHEHEHEHKSDINNFRPDIDYNCGDSTLENDFNADKYNGNSLIQSLPGIFKEELNESSGFGNSTTRPSIRRIDEVLNNEAMALKSFWNNSSLTSAFDRNHLHEEYLILQQEMNELDRVKDELRKGEQQNNIWNNKIASNE